MKHILIFLADLLLAPLVCWSTEIPFAIR